MRNENGSSEKVSCMDTICPGCVTQASTVGLGTGEGVNVSVGVGSRVGEATGEGICVAAGLVWPGRLVLVGERVDDKAGDGSKVALF